MSITPEFLFSIDIVLIVLISALFYCIIIRKYLLSVRLLDEIINAAEHGNVIFNKKGRFFKADNRATSYLSTMVDGCIKDLTQSEFLDYMYDNAAELDDNIRNTILNDFDNDNVPEFREIIYCKGKGYILVEARSISGNMTIFALTDINVEQKREKDIISLNTINQQLMHAVQATTSGIVISDPKSEFNSILFANEAFCDFVNCDLPDLIGSSWSVVMDMIQDQKDKDKFIDAVQNSKELDLTLEAGAGETGRHFNMKLSPAIDDNGKLNLFIGILSEITLLKQREAEFFHAQKLESLGQLSAGVAHDFNNILSIIGGYSVMANNFLEGKNEQVSSYLDRIDAAAKRGADLTRKMLTFSRHKVVTQTVIDVCDVIKEQQELLVPLLGVSINLQVDMPDEGLNIKGSSGSLGQILMNFAVNGRDAMLDGGNLSISVSSVSSEYAPVNIRKKVDAEDYVCISVSDTGTGIDDATLERIFDPFFSTKDQGKGTGLGLSVVYGLAQEMGGAIDVLSVMGEGTTMSLYVPRCHEKKSKNITGSAADLSKICLDGYSVLVAEDEPDLLILVTNMLEEMGLTVYGASDGDEALVLLDDHLDDGIDILLTDVVMPGLNGVKLAELVSSMSPETKIIFMSGYPANGDMAPVELPEDLSFVAKPVDYNALAALLLSKLRVEAPESMANATEFMPRWETTSVNKEINDEQ